MKIKNIKRKAKILIPNIIAASSIIGCSFLSTSCGEQYDLVIGNWADYVAGGDDNMQNAVYQFAKLTGLNVKYVVYDTNETLNETWSKYDVAVPSDYNIEYLAQNNMIQKLDYSKIHVYSDSTNKLDASSSKQVVDIDDPTSDNPSVKSFNYDGAIGVPGCNNTDTTQSETCYKNAYWTGSPSETDPSKEHGYFLSYIPYNSPDAEYSPGHYGLSYQSGRIGYFINKSRFNDTDGFLDKWSDYNTKQDGSPSNSGLTWTALFNWMVTHVKTDPETNRPYSISFTDDMRNDLLVGSLLHAEETSCQTDTTSQACINALTNQENWNPNSQTTVDNSIKALSNVVSNKGGYVFAKDSDGYSGVYDENNKGQKFAASLSYNGEYAGTVSQDRSTASNFTFITPRITAPQDLKNPSSPQINFSLTNNWNDAFVIKSGLSQDKINNAYKFLTFMSAYDTSMWTGNYLGYVPTTYQAYQDYLKQLSNIPALKNPTDAENVRKVLSINGNINHYYDSIYHNFTQEDIRTYAIKTWNVFKNSFNNV